jgi:hypothetical protein
MATVLKDEDVVRVLQEVRGKTPLRKFAKEIGCSAGYLCDVLKQKHGPGFTIMKYLGLERRRKVETTYVWK